MWRRVREVRRVEGLYDGDEESNLHVDFRYWRQRDVKSSLLDISSLDND